MDETIEEEMSQDMEKGFSVLGTAFGVSVNNWGDLPLRRFWVLPLSDICKLLAGLCSLLRLMTKNRSSRLAVLPVWDVKELHIGTFKNDHLYPSLRKQPTFRDAATGFSAKWLLRNERRNSILTTCHYPEKPFGPEGKFWNQILLNSSTIPSSQTSQFSSLTDGFTLSFSKLLELWSWMQTWQT